MLTFKVQHFPPSCSVRAPQQPGAPPVMACLVRGVRIRQPSPLHLLPLHPQRSASWSCHPRCCLIPALSPSGRWSCGPAGRPCPRRKGGQGWRRRRKAPWQTADPPMQHRHRRRARQKQPRRRHHPHRHRRHHQSRTLGWTPPPPSGTVPRCRPGRSQSCEYLAFALGGPFGVLLEMIVSPLCERVGGGTEETEWIFSPGVGRLSACKQTCEASAGGPIVAACREPLCSPRQQVAEDNPTARFPAFLRLSVQDERPVHGFAFTQEIGIERQKADGPQPQLKNLL